MPAMGANETVGADITFADGTGITTTESGDTITITGHTATVDTGGAVDCLSIHRQLIGGVACQ